MLPLLLPDCPRRWVQVCWALQLSSNLENRPPGQNKNGATSEVCLANCGYGPDATEIAAPWTLTFQSHPTI